MKFLEFLAEHRTPFFDRFFSIVTYLGWETIFLVVALPMLSLGIVAAVPIIAWYVILSVYLFVMKK